MTAPNRLLLIVVMLLAALAGCGPDAKSPPDSPPPSTSHEITTFAFRSAQNPALTSDIAAVINADAIAVTVPTGTNVSGLVATFETTGASVTVGGTMQVSGTTANNFSSPVTYHVTAESGATRDYTVTVTVAPATSKSISLFSFEMSHNASLPNDVTATINGTAISATVPAGTSVTALVATFTTTGQSVTVGATAQVSGTTPNNFTSAVSYVVHAADSSTQTYTVTVTVAPSSAKDITAFSFLSAQNPALAADLTGTITGNAIAVAAPFGTSVTALKATFTSTGQSVMVQGVAQTSGTTANDFTAPVVYRVTAADSTTRDYTVTVTVAANPAKDITAFSFRSAQNPSLPADVTGTIAGTAISVTVPFGTPVTALIATFSTTGQAVTVGGTDQVSGITPNSFASPVVYRVRAADNTTKDYTVTVTVASGNAKDLTSFAFRSVNNPALATDVTGTITGTAIAVMLPFGTSPVGLVAAFQSTGGSVSVGAVTQVSGVTANNFTAPVVYTVHALDSSTQDYTVTVTVAASPAKDITAFSFLVANNPSLTSDVTATIAGTAITAVLPSGASTTSLIATFTTTGASVAVGATPQVSGTTPNNFTSPVNYVVTAADGSTKSYTVTVSVAGGPAKDIISFAFLAANNPGLAADVTATVAGTAITATIPSGPDPTQLVATFTTTGQSVAVGATAQVSGTTPNDFTSPVVYRVTATDASTKDYTVTIAVTCASLTAPTNGSVAVSNGGIAPSTATYSCNVGYAVDATETRMCSANGSWSGAAPGCALGVMVVRVGTGAAAPTNASTAVFLEEHALTTGFLARTITLPTAASGAQAAFTMSGTANTEGMLARSVDGTVVTLAGYAVAPGTASISTSANVTTNVASINRAVAFVKANGTMDTSTLLADAFNGSSPRGAVGSSASAFYVTGAAGSAAGPGGVHYVAASSTGTTVRVMTPADTTTSFGHIAGGQLYVSTSTAVSAVGSGTPITTGNALTPLATTANVRSFAVFDRDAVVTGPDTIYVALSTAVTGGSNQINVAKFTYNGTAWTQAAFAPTFTSNVGALGLAAWVEGSNIRLVATQAVAGAGGNRLVTFVDDGVTTAPATTVIGTAAANTQYRGTAPSPNAP